eukprot:TRINITY_DN10022_c0_g1_i1.p1 TRINITY_DN10022_c0_g1~~TRINITY_DN10022_c0_g1_i1.p1  ORF type:complete len:351 (+),score=73.25 TRINITY_DN10022_c0_g1_i1:60-1055(+)
MNYFPILSSSPSVPPQSAASNRSSVSSAYVPSPLQPPFASAHAPNVSSTSASTSISPTSTSAYPHASTLPLSSASTSASTSTSTSTPTSSSLPSALHPHTVTGPNSANAHASFSPNSLRYAIQKPLMHAQHIATTTRDGRMIVSSVEATLERDPRHKFCAVWSLVTVLFILSIGVAICGSLWVNGEKILFYISSATCGVFLLTLMLYLDFRASAIRVQISRKGISVSRRGIIIRFSAFYDQIRVIRIVTKPMLMANSNTQLMKLLGSRASPSHYQSLDIDLKAKLHVESSCGLNRHIELPLPESNIIIVNKTCQQISEILHVPFIAYGCDA